MTMPLLRVGRLPAVLRQARRAVARTAIAVPWRRTAASRVPPTRFADNGPVRIAYDVRGRGRPLVLVQGVGVGRWGWHPVADRLARRCQVITIDNRGIGASDTPPGPFTIRAMAQDVLAVLDHAGIQQASVLGTSLGGMVAQELALIHPGWIALAKGHSGELGHLRSPFRPAWLTAGRCRPGVGESGHGHAVDRRRAARGAESARTAATGFRSRPVADAFGASVLRDQ
jgi:pimeloyl-ACP methyl ester carboxylesterase